MTSPFKSAKPSTGIVWEDVKGRLVLVSPLAVETDIVTQHGETDAIRADVVVLDGDEPGEEYADTLIFPKKLQGQLRRSIGGMVLGRVGQGAKEKGKNAPWIFETPTPADEKTAMDYLAKKGAPTPAADEEKAPF